MVNRAAVAVVMGLVVGAMLVGVVIGMMISESGTAASTGTTTPTDVQPTPLPGTTADPGSTPIPTASRTAAPTPTPTSQPTDAPRTTIASDEFFAEDVEDEILRLVNERRQNRGLEPLTADGKLGATLERMAQNHSDDMARVDTVRHTIDERTTEERYEDYGVYGSCSWDAADGNYVIQPSETTTEVLGRTVAGRPYFDDGSTQFNANETAVARAIVDEWFEGFPHEGKLVRADASHLGVGVHITRSGEVFVTGNTCGA